jgi:hypothetical protein
MSNERKSSSKPASENTTHVPDYIKAIPDDSDHQKASQDSGTTSNNAKKAIEVVNKAKGS